jgi:NADH-quinone oxidoreductase subunit F
VLTTIRYFRDEYEAHIEERRCPAHACTALIAYAIDPEACTGCTLCAKKCPVNAVSGDKKQPHAIDQDLCIKCDSCRAACKFDAVVVASGEGEIAAAVDGQVHI